MNVMWAAILVGAVSIVIQTVLLFTMALNSRAIRKQITSLVSKVEPVAESGRRLLQEVRSDVREISARANDLLDLSRKQVARVDEVLGEAAARARAQMDRIEMVLDDTVNRFQETTTLLQNGILKPLKQLNALTLGIRTALSILTRGNRTTVAQATHDEEMFI
jgi:ABC-type transporter Mla subunit MlaD